MNSTLRHFTEEKLSELISVSRFRAPATAWIKEAHILNLYTGEWSKQNVVLFEDRIAYVGEKEPLTDANTQIIEAQGYTLVPGYIEPHAHSFHMYNPRSLGEYALARGTTTILHDNISFFLQLQQHEFEGLIEALEGMPVKNFWWARLDPNVREKEMQRQFTADRVRRMLRNPSVLQAGELTYWKEAINGDPSMIARMREARLAGKRIETHNPGASVETLNAVAAAGATGCHESITAEEVMRRLRLGYYATLRHSSIRPDLGELIKGLLNTGCRYWDRMMLTTDGSPPFFLAEGFTDACIRIAIDAGLDPVDAYRMASLNPAVYYGLDQDLGGISPGRIADIVFLEDLRNPTPVKVMANGRIAAERGMLTASFPEVEWSRYGIVPLAVMDPCVQPEWFEVYCAEDKIPVIELVNAVITHNRLERLTVIDGKVRLTDSPGYVYVSLLDRRGEWITVGVMKGFGEVDALASTYSLTGDLIVLGRDPVQMARAANHVLAGQGGICVVHQGDMRFDLSLPLLGTMSLLDMDALIAETSRLLELLRESGFGFADPIYSLEFLSSTHLPKVRLTSQGVININNGEILIPSRPLR
ncbi:adenine deaminase C-terminal domain-containing protein [Paenibacillus naphthalenovorans]|uniref:adenine deaminase C-terminal domain-containing protein n=1 Tax=Paenibacillus naphthalenovorans TaxID=162209 RepID=UPI00088097CC|nr:adenine deaminase C-terminal domain-containing protein [Paenibacillus naphthalenovorans]SDI93228.1 adenine deaminase [Paenibacillus naphthalenovorans]